MVWLWVLMSNEYLDETSIYSCLEKKRSGINITNLIRLSEEVLQINSIEILNKYSELWHCKVKFSSSLIKRKWSDIMVNCWLSLCHAIVIYKWEERSRATQTPYEFEYIHILCFIIFYFELKFFFSLCTLTTCTAQYAVHSTQYTQRKTRNGI